MKFETKVEKFESSLWGHHFKIPEDVAANFDSKKIRRVVCIIDDHFEFQCAIHSDGRGGRYITLNKANRKKLGLFVGAQIMVELKEDTSKYGLPIPLEMEELLSIDDEADKMFHSLTPGKQRTLLHIIGKPKSSDIRLRKAVAIVDYLKEVNGKLDFKELNEALKVNR